MVKYEGTSKVKGTLLFGELFTCNYIPTNDFCRKPEPKVPTIDSVIDFAAWPGIHGPGLSPEGHVIV